jgi:predicted transcriptional regulator
MTLTVRLDETLAGALDDYCAERGVTKSAVVQEALALHLSKVAARRPAPRGGFGPTYLAFAEAGLIGTGELDGRSADKAVVRERAMARISRNWPAPGAPAKGSVDAK